MYRKLSTECRDVHNGLGALVEKDCVATEKKEEMERAKAAEEEEALLLSGHR